MRRGALAGRTVLVTRAAEDAERWTIRLRNLGAKPVLLPCLLCEPICDPVTAERLREAVDAADWLVFQSARGAESAARLLNRVLPERLRTAAVGAATAEAVRTQFGRVDLVASHPTSEGLARELLARGVDSSSRVVIAAAEGGLQEAERVLSAAGVTVVRVSVYRTIPAPPDGSRCDLAAAGVDTIVLASPSAVTGLLNRAVPSPAARIITIGPTTSAAARAAGLAVAAEARQPDLAGIVEAMS